MSGKIEIGARVKANNDELSAMLRAERADLASTKAAHQEAERLLEGARSERDAAAKGLHEALNNCGELATSLGAASRDLQAARDTLSKVSVAVDVVRHAWKDGMIEGVDHALEALDRVLRGVAPMAEGADVPGKIARLTVGEEERRLRDTVERAIAQWLAYFAALDKQHASGTNTDADIVRAARGEAQALDRIVGDAVYHVARVRHEAAPRCEPCTAANGTATHHAPGEPCDPRWDLGVEERLHRLEAALREQGDRLGLLSAAVESISVHGGGR